jgi:phosphohistidine phosphatase
MGTLMLLRHAKSDWPAGVDDLQRPLADRGMGDATAAGRVVAGLGAPELVLCSPARRAQETWQLVATGLAPSAPAVRLVPGIYGADDEELLEILRVVPEAVGSCLVLGHNPTMQETASRLAGPGSDPGALSDLRAKYPTAGLAVLTFDGPWTDLKPGAARLERFLVPRGPGDSGD